MGLRESINRHPVAVGAAAVVLAVGAVLFVVFRAGGGPQDVVPQSFYSADDGATYFSDFALRVTPFKRDGKEVVAATVFVEEGVERPYVGLLQKYTPQAQAALAAEPDVSKHSDILESIGGNPLLVKRPGETQWVDFDSAAGQQVRNVRPRAGKQPRILLPS